MIADECHNVGSNTIVDKLPENIDYRIGLSTTLKENMIWKVVITCTNFLTLTLTALLFHIQCIRQSKKESYKIYLHPHFL